MTPGSLDCESGILPLSYRAVCEQFPHTLVHSQVITMKILKEDTQRRRVYDMDKPYGGLLLISQKGILSLDWPCLDTLLLFKLMPLLPALFDCHGCLRKYVGATSTQTGQLEREEQGTCRRHRWCKREAIKKIAWAKTGIGLPTHSA